MEHIEGLEKELFTKNEVIEDLRKEKQIKAEETVKAQMVILLLEKNLQHYNIKNLSIKFLSFTSNLS